MTRVIKRKHESTSKKLRDSAYAEIDYFGKYKKVKRSQKKKLTRMIAAKSFTNSNTYFKLQHLKCWQKNHPKKSCLFPAKYLISELAGYEKDQLKII